MATFFPATLTDPLTLLDKFEPFPGSSDFSQWTGPNFIVERGYWETYKWLVVMGAIFAFAMAWSIGANDVANSFATSVGARTVTLWQACIIAAIFEFTGAMVLGGEVARTVAGSITSPAYFAQVPEVFAFGMMIAVGTAATIVTIATYWCAAVSTTHSIIGAVIGFGLIYGGGPAIVWNEKTDEFPFRRGVVTIFLSWFISPIMAGILSMIIFLFNRTVILRRQNSTTWAFWSLPFLAFVTIFINLLFVLMKGAGKELSVDKGWDKAGKKAAWVSACAAAGAALLCVPAVLYLQKRLKAKLAKADVETKGCESETDEKAKELALAEEAAREPRTGFTAPFLNVYDKVKKQLKHGLTMDIHEDIHKDATVSAMHANAEIFNPETEEVYKYLQVFSACCVSFAHGANDTANAIGPFAGIWYVYRNRAVASNAETPKWVLALGGAGIVVGLATYGYNIMKVLGVQMATMTPSRGFAAELATALTIAIATIYGLPVSTTQTIVGAEVGIGLSEGLKGHGLNKRLLLNTIFGWVIAFSFAGMVSAGAFAFCVYAPSLNDLDYVANWQQAMTSVMRTEITVMNNTNLQGFTALNKNITGLATNITAMNNFRRFGKTNLYDMALTFRNVTWLYVNWTLPYMTGAVPAPAPLG